MEQQNNKSPWIKFWFVSSEIKWLWLVTGNKYLLLCYSLEEVGVLDQVGGLTVGDGVAELYKMC